MVSSFSADRERVAIPVDKYLREISVGLDTYWCYPEKPAVLEVVRGEIQVYDGRLRRNINLFQRDYAEASDQIAGRLAMMADIQRRGFNDPGNAAHLYRMASGAERVSRKNLGNHNEVIKCERAALEIIYMADAVQALREAGKPEIAYSWREERRMSLREAYGLIAGPGRARRESPSPRQESRSLDRAAEAYVRGRLMMPGM